MFTYIPFAIHVDSEIKNLNLVLLVFRNHVCAKCCHRIFFFILILKLTT